MRGWTLKSVTASSLFIDEEQVMLSLAAETMCMCWDGGNNTEAKRRERLQDRFQTIWEGFRKETSFSGRAKVWNSECVIHLIQYVTGKVKQPHLEGGKEKWNSALLQVNK